MKKSFLCVLMMLFLVAELSIFAGIKIERFALNYLPIGQYPFTKIMYEKANNVNMAYTNENGKLIFYRVLREKHLTKKWNAVDQINLQLSYDSCQNWLTIFQSPLDYEIENFSQDFENTFMDYKIENYKNPICLDVINSGYIVISGTDSSGFIISLRKQEDGRWNVFGNIRFQSNKIQPKELLSINTNENLCILENQENHSFHVLKTSDFWKTYKEVYVSKYSTNFDNPNLDPELKFLRKNQKRIKDDLLVFKHQFENELIVTDKDFKKIQIIDFVDNKEIINLRVLNDRIFYVVTKEQKDKDIIYSIQKSTDTGNSWAIIFSEINNTSYPFYDFKIKDENNLLLRGDYFINERGEYYKIKYSNDGGKKWQYVFYSIDPFFPNINSYDELFTFGNIYNLNARFFQWKYVPNFAGYGNPIYKTFFMDYLENNILLINSINPMTTDTSTYPKKFRLNEEYGFRCPECTFHDTEAPWLINYLLIKPNEKELDLPRMSLINGAKILYREDTLKWQKIEGANKYNVRIFKTGIFYPHVVDYLLDTTVTENYLATPNLPKGYGYVFSARAENETEKGRYSVFYASEPVDALSLQKPKFLSPQYNDTLNDIGRPDSVHFGELKLEWEEVPNAKYYMLYVFEDTIGPVIQVGNVQRGGTTITKPVVIAEYIKDTKYSYKYMKRDRIYQVTLWAENEVGISLAKTVHYALSDENSIIEINNSNILIYPNPTSNKLTLSQIPAGAVSYEIYDLFGSKVLSTQSSLRDATPQEGNWEIDVSKLTPGIYFIKIGTQPPLKFVKI